ncbi:MAG: radical SAM domain-containing protein [Burkholderiaceae bacterium]|nr:radical SAM domain-containing protein [Microbacteriaceae bacterium]
MSALTTIRRFELDTRPIHPATRIALDKRWADLPESAKTANQLIGRCAVGCEGTHGVFPKCDLTCSPCYHSADANKVRIDGAHTVSEVDEQMRFLNQMRGPRAHAQLIGGEVSLLPAEDHAQALLTMRKYGREPMSMTHGDFSYEYLLDVVLDADGKPRFDKVSFAAHFDSLMRGRRGAVRPHSEAELNPFRERFAKMFIDLKKDHGVKSYLAHNMTVTPSNVGEVASVTRDVLDMPYDMMSFQPAAFIGDDRRWKEDFTEVTIDSVWEQIEEGAGHRIPWKATQFGDPRCNRSTVGMRVDGTFAVLLDADNPKDIAARDRFLEHFGGMIFGDIPKHILTIKIIRAIAGHPGDLAPLVGLASRVVTRAGGLRRMIRAARRGKLGFKTFVVHNFMDAVDVVPAWELMEKGIASDDPKIKETQERLGSCMYAMSHPEDGRLVPACTQHSVLDPIENIGLRKLLPLIGRTAADSATEIVSRPSGMTPVRSTRRADGAPARP